MTYQECEEWGIPYMGPYESEFDEMDNQGQYYYEVQRQQELDEQAEAETEQQRSCRQET